jgi:hypothetical protein
MSFKRFYQTTAFLFAFCVAMNAGPVVNTLDTTAYNFQLDGGGGGAQAVLNKTSTIEVFCVDYSNPIYVPQQGYQAVLSTLTTGSDLSDTRFGSVTSWTSLASGYALTSSAASFLNSDTAALDRYQMAAFLVSEYNMSDGPGTLFKLNGSNTNNDGIQQAIWDLMDPKNQTYGNIAYAQYTDTALFSAESWFTSTTASQRSSFLANYRIVSDVTMKPCAGNGGMLCGGFQEQITVVPEPRHLALLLMGLLLIGSAVYRKFSASRSNA